MRRMLQAAAVVLLAAAPALAQAPVKQEFTVNTATTGQIDTVSVASRANGGFVVVWDAAYGANDSRATGQRFDSAGERVGAEFLVAASTNALVEETKVAVDPAGGFVVVWSEFSGSGGQNAFGRRYDAAGVGGAAFPLSTSATTGNRGADVAVDAAGNFVAVWVRSDAGSYSVLGQRFTAAGARLGAEFAVGGPGNAQFSPTVRFQDNGDFVAVWSDTPPPGPYRILGRRYTGSTGAPNGAEFEVVSNPSRGQGAPALAMASGSRFSVTWLDNFSADNPESYRRGRSFAADGTALGPDHVLHIHPAFDPYTFFGGNVVYSRDELVTAWTYNRAGAGIRLRRFDETGAPRGPVFELGQAPGQHDFPSLSSDAAGNVVAVWSNHQAVRAQRFGRMSQQALFVDSTPDNPSDGNGVLEPGEVVYFEPAWRNNGDAVRPLGGWLFELTGPPGGGYSVLMDIVNYGLLAPGETRRPTSPYLISLIKEPSRPLTHWDARAGEAMGPEAELVYWPVHVGDSFTDVPRSSPFYRSVETILHHNVTAGCQDGLRFCPAQAVTREEMAPFLLAAREEPGYRPRSCEAGSLLFTDVPASSPFCRFIEELARRGVTGGCGNGRYCPGDPVTREQMAVFLLRTLDPALNPPACTTPVFGDVPASSPFCRWIEELVRRGVTAGCGGGNYCPTQAVTREQMAAFLSTTFGLTLYGP